MVERENIYDNTRAKTRTTRVAISFHYESLITSYYEAMSNKNKANFACTSTRTKSFIGPQQIAVYTVNNDNVDIIRWKHRFLSFMDTHPTHNGHGVLSSNHKKGSLSCNL